MEKTCLPDVQCSSANIERPIYQVGVENVELPFQIEMKSGGFKQLHANVSMRTNLDEKTKGISMSRLTRTLKPFLDLPLKQTLIKEILYKLKENLETEESFMKFEFKYPLLRQSILSDNIFPIYYKCRFEGQLFSKEDRFQFYQGATIQYASYCPCSAELSKHLEDHESKGFPHNQRSYAHILIECDPDHYIWLEDIIEAVESNIKTLPYPIIKRVDEQEIARVAAENPIFVEDAIRIISTELDKLPIKDWIVKCIHEESIHTHEAIAVNWKGVRGGFDGRRYL
jgi:GTP cyclohydrolase I